MYLIRICYDLTFQIIRAIAQGATSGGQITTIQTVQWSIQTCFVCIMSV